MGASGGQRYGKRNSKRNKRLLELYAKGLHTLQIRKLLIDEGYKPTSSEQIAKIAREHGLYRSKKAKSDEAE